MFCGERFSLPRPQALLLRAPAPAVRGDGLQGKWGALWGGGQNLLESGGERINTALSTPAGRPTGLWGKQQQTAAMNLTTRPH